ncbi:MAG: glycosyltransferase family 39 protein [Anaerolineae bacterium]|nr:glycosyltransferase family 39 protein [Anaerolineae bacterium]
MKRYKLFVLGFLLISFALRLYKLGAFELWVDEAASYYIASLSSPKKILTYSATALYEHPPLFYIFLHFWIKWMGKGEWLLRFPSVFWGVLSIALAWPLFKRLVDEKVALLTVILMTFYSPLVALSQEVRMYALVIALSLVINLVLLAFSERNPLAGMAFYIIVAILGFLVHYFFLWIFIAPYCGLFT